MEQYLSILTKSQLFSGVSADEIRAMLHCLDARTAVFQKGSYIFRAGEPAAALGLVLAGEAAIVHEDFWGNRNLLSSIGQGQCFAESFACAEDTVMNVSVAAETDCTILFLKVRQMLTLCPESCGHHQQMIRNLLTVLARKNLAFSEKLSHLGQRSTRAKLLSYLSAESQRQGSDSFEIPFSRQQLADYLFVERSGLSQELSRMQKDGLIEYHKNHFLLK